MVADNFLKALGYFDSDILHESHDHTQAGKEGALAQSCGSCLLHNYTLAVILFCLFLSMFQ